MRGVTGFWNGWRDERRPGMRVLIAVASALAVGSPLLLAAWVGVCRNGSCPNPAAVERLQQRSTSRIFAADGSLLASVGYEERDIIPLDSMAPILRQAFLVTEDRRFNRHNGVDYLRIFGAWGPILPTGRSARDSPPSRCSWPGACGRRPWIVEDRSIIRKMREMQVAWLIERRFTKSHILDLYLNQVLLGPQIYGVEPAARQYFGKSARDLNVAEAALLAALPKAPSSYNPRRFPDRAIARRNLVIDLLRKNGDLTGEEADQWKRVPLGLAPEDSSRIVAPYFVDYVRSIVGERIGDQLENGGLRIYTTLDPAIPGDAERALERQLVAIEKGRYGAYRRDHAGAVPEGRPRGARELRFALSPGDGAGTGAVDRPHPGHGRWPRLGRQQVQSRDPGPAAGGLGLQAVRVLGGVAQGLSALPDRR
jgi:penicillin-binding protein 1A